MDAAREGIRKEHGEMTVFKLLVDQLEAMAMPGTDRPGMAATSTSCG
jgi:hypothetical protein